MARPFRALFALVALSSSKLLIASCMTPTSTLAEVEVRSCNVVIVEEDEVAADGQAQLVDKGLVISGFVRSEKVVRHASESSAGPGGRHLNGSHVTFWIASSPDAANRSISSVCPREYPSVLHFILQDGCATGGGSWYPPPYRWGGGPGFSRRFPFAEGLRVSIEPKPDSWVPVDG